MKIAVYTIAKNEQAFIQRWYDSAKEADHMFENKFPNPLKPRVSCGQL